MLILFASTMGDPPANTEISGLASGGNGSDIGALVSGMLAGLTVQQAAILLAAELITAERAAQVSGLPETSAGGVLLAASATTVGGLVIGEEPPAEPSYGDFTIQNMVDLDVAASGADIYTTLTVRFDYDWVTKDFRKAILLEAPERFRDYGRVPYTLEAKWLKSPRQAFLLGERMLRYLARPRWDISYTDGIDSAAIPPGVWVTVANPHVPAAGRMLVMNSELDPSSASVRLAMEAITGDVPEIVLAKLSEAYAPQTPDGISVSYVAGHLILTISSEDGKPLSGAEVTLDGGLTLMTDTRGVVSFQTGRGTHNLEIVAVGYASQNVDVTV